MILRARLGAGSELAERRAELVARVAAIGVPAWIVFDSKARREAGRVQRTFRHVRVQFARPDQTADDVLIEAARRAKDLRSLVLVTDDRELSGRCRFLGLRTLGVEAFMERLQPTTETPERPDRPLSKQEIEDWLRYFGVDREKGPGKD